jgi:hypothetical protein
LTFRNDKPVFLWVFALVFLTFVALMTYVLVRDGAPPGYSPLFLTIVMGVFALAGLGLGYWVSGMRRLRVEVDPEGSLFVTWWSPFWKETRHVSAREVVGSEVVEERDSEGDPYFYSRVRLRDGVTLDLTESHSREACEEALRRFDRVRL